MKRTFRLLIIAMMVALVGNVMPAVPAVAAQEAEAQPVGMVSGAWRMMAWQFAIAPSFPELGLEKQDGHNWGILIVDMTNTGVSSGLSIADVTLGESSGDPARSVEISRELGFTAIGDDGVLPVAENGIARVAVVFDYTGDPMILSVGLGDQTVSVVSVLSDVLDVAGLPEAPTEMLLEHVTPSRYYLPFERIGVDLPDGRVRDIQIAGIVAPDNESCHGRLAVDRARLLAAEGVWIEDIPGVDAPTLWVSNPDAYSFALLDAVLVESGLVRVDNPDSPEASVYSRWLVHAQESAKENRLGAWGACPANSEVIESAESAIGRDRESFTPVNPAALYASPQSYIGTKIMISGVVDGISYESGMTVLTLYNIDSGVFTIFGVGYRGALPNVTNGQYISVYGVVTQVTMVPNNSGVMTRVPLILATIIE